MIITIIIFLLLSFICGKLYASITNETPGHLLDLKDINDSIRKLNGVWWFMIPIISLFAMVYNLAVTAVWFALIVLGWVIKLIKWIWVEIIIAAGWMLLRIIFHYFIKWPWRIFKAAFEAIKPSVNLANYKTATIGLFFSFLLAFTGKFLVDKYQLPEYIINIFITISILPLGLALALIIHSINTQSPLSNRKAIGKYLKYALYLILFFSGLCIVQGVLIHLGTYTSFKHLFSSTIVGVSLIGSVFIIFNAVLLLFILSALPSWSQNNDDNKNFLKDFGIHLLNKWPQYLFALPALLIPAVIVSIIPYVIAQGATYISKTATEFVYQERIQTLTEKINKADNVGDYNKWLDISIINDDSLAKLMKLDAISMTDNEELKTLIINANYFGDYYSKHSSSIGAAPVGALFFTYNEYSKAHNSLVNTQPYNSAAIDSVKDEVNMKSKENVVAELQSNIKATDEMLLKLNIQLAKVCFISAEIKELPQNAFEPEPVPVPVPVQQQAVDTCESQRVALREQINNTQNSKTQFERELARELARNNAIVDHLNNIKHMMISFHSNDKASTSSGYVLVTIWLALLLSLVLGLALSLFAHLNHSIYNMNDTDSKWMLLDEIEKAKKINPNQPLLGLLLLSLLISIFTVKGFHPQHLINKAGRMMNITIQLPFSNNPTIEESKPNNESFIISDDQNLTEEETVE